MSSPVLIAAVVSLFLRGVLIGIIAKKGLNRSYACFLAYLIFSIVSTIARLLVRNHYLLFFYTFWITEAVYAVLSFLVIVEIFWRVFRDFYENELFRFTLGCLVIVLLALTLVVPVGHHVDAPSVTAVILSANIVLRLVQVCALVLFLSLFVLLDVQKWRYDLGIVLGYGFFAVVYLVALSLRSQLGANYGWTVSLGHPIAYDCAAGIWLLAFSRGQRPASANGYTGSVEKIASQTDYFRTAHRRLSSKRWLG